MARESWSLALICAQTIVIGGAFMLLQVHNRKSTDDIDVLFKDVENPSASPFYQLFKGAVQAVAVRKRLRGSWLNDLMAEILQDISRVPAGTLWQQLQIQTQEQAKRLIDRYIPDPQVQQMNHLDRTLKWMFGA